VKKLAMIDTSDRSKMLLNLWRLGLGPGACCGSLRRSRDRVRDRRGKTK